MKSSTPRTSALLVAALVSACGLVWHVNADEASNPIKESMKAFHKAPKGVDPVCKKAGDGKASAEELSKLVASYKTLISAKPPRGDEASWKAKTTALLAAAEGLKIGAPDAAAKYKEAVNCKACHSVHKPETK